jgi:arsenate reductase
VKSNVLFICIHNSARSQMAEAWLNHICGDFFSAESAGLEPGTLNPFVVRAMQEIGIDISQKKTQAVFDVFKAGKLFSHVVTVCDETSAEKCPVFPGITKRLHWSFADPSALTGNDEEKMAGVRKIREEIRAKVKKWCKEVCPRGAAA